MTARRQRDRRPAADRRGSLVLVGLSFVGFVSIGLPDGLLGVAWPSMRRDLDVPLDALGGYLLAVVAGYLTASVTSGRVVRRLGVGLVLALSCLLTAGSLLGIALAPLWVLVLGFGIVAGLGAGAIDAGLNAFAALRFSPRAMNWMHASFSAGVAGGPVLMGALLDAGYPWRWGYGVVGAAQGLLGVAFLLTIDRWNVPGTSITAEDATRDGTEARPRRGALLLAGAAFFTYTGAEVTAGGWAYSLLVEARGMDGAPASLAVSGFWAALAGGRVLFGVIANRLEAVSLVRACGAGIVAGALLVWLDAGTLATVAGLVTIGFAAAPIFPTLISSTPTRFGARGATDVVGVQIGAAALGAALLPGLAGIFAARTSLEIVPPFVALLGGLMLAAHEGLLRRSLRAPG